MRTTSYLFVLAAVALAACDPAGPASTELTPVEPPAPQIQSQRIEAATCPANAFQYLVGSPIDEAREVLLPVAAPVPTAPAQNTVSLELVGGDLSADAADPNLAIPDAPKPNIRFLGPDEYVSRDYDGSRLTLTTLRKDGEDVVGRVFCG